MIQRGGVAVGICTTDPPTPRRAPSMARVASAQPVRRAMYARERSRRGTRRAPAAATRRSRRPERELITPSSAARDPRRDAQQCRSLPAQLAPTHHVRLVDPRSVQRLEQGAVGESATTFLRATSVAVAGRLRSPPQSRPASRVCGRFGRGSVPVSKSSRPSPRHHLPCRGMAARRLCRAQ